MKIRQYIYFYICIFYKNIWVCRSENKYQIRNFNLLYPIVWSVPVWCFSTYDWLYSSFWGVCILKKFPLIISMVFQVNTANTMLFHFMSPVLQHIAGFFHHRKTQKWERLFFNFMFIIYYLFISSEWFEGRVCSATTSVYNRVNDPCFSTRLCPSLPSSTVNISQACSY